MIDNDLLILTSTTATNQVSSSVSQIPNLRGFEFTISKAGVSEER